MRRTVAASSFQPRAGFGFLANREVLDRERTQALGGEHQRELLPAHIGDDRHLAHQRVVRGLEIE